MYNKVKGSKKVFNNFAFNKCDGWINDSFILSNGVTVTLNFNSFNFITFK